MSLTIFSEQWGESWCEALNNNSSYREAAKTWKGAILFCITRDQENGFSEEKAILLDLSEGRCLGSRLPDATDWEAVPFIIEGPPGAWRDLLERKADPLMSLVSGKLKLKRGSLVQLMPYVRASKELLEAALTLDTHFPENNS